MKIKEQALVSIAISLLGLFASLIIAIGLTLIVEKEIWLGLIPIILGYEIIRYMVILIWRNVNES